MRHDSLARSETNKASNNRLLFQHRRNRSNVWENSCNYRCAELIVFLYGWRDFYAVNQTRNDPVEDAPEQSSTTADQSFHSYILKETEEHIFFLSRPFLKRRDIKKPLQNIRSFLDCLRNSTLPVSTTRHLPRFSDFCKSLIGGWNFFTKVNSLGS